MKIKQKPEHFKVTEIPLYTPCGEGQHFYLLIRKEMLTTKDVVKILKDKFQISEKDIGYAGLKDKFAVTTQYFSLSLGRNFEKDKIKEILNDLPFEVLKIEKHSNKLKVGHLVGNQFEILLTDVSKGEMDLAVKNFEKISKHGFYNFYGGQRFGDKGDNAEIGFSILKGEKKVKDRFKQRMYLSAFQSDIFNKWIEYRFFELKEILPVTGDLLISSKGGKSFFYEPDNEQQKKELERGEISIAGPMFGLKMNVSKNRASEIENELLERLKIDLDQTLHKKISGTRRPLRVFLLGEREIKVLGEKELKVRFSLPKGSYATTLIEQLKEENDAL